MSTAKAICLKKKKKKKTKKTFLIMLYLKRSKDKMVNFDALKILRVYLRIYFKIVSKYLCDVYLHCPIRQPLTIWDYYELRCSRSIKFTDFEHLV